MSALQGGFPDVGEALGSSSQLPESLEKTGPGKPPFSLTLGAYSHAKQIPALWHILFSARFRVSPSDCEFMSEGRMLGTQLNDSF